MYLFLIPFSTDLADRRIMLTYLDMETNLNAYLSDITWNLNECPQMVDPTHYDHQTFPVKMSIFLHSPPLKTFIFVRVYPSKSARENILFSQLIENT